MKEIIRAIRAGQQTKLNVDKFPEWQRKYNYFTRQYDLIPPTKGIKRSNI